MVVLVIGDVVGDPGMDTLYRCLRQLKKQVGADLTIVNGENATPVGKGITPALAEEIFDMGADVITLGNHTFGNRQICDYLDDQPNILRPLNYPPQQPGHGYAVGAAYGRSRHLSDRRIHGMDGRADLPVREQHQLQPGRLCPGVGNCRGKDKRSGTWLRT